jgi:hypothetical protein
MMSRAFGTTLVFTLCSWVALAPPLRAEPSAEAVEAQEAEIEPSVARGIELRRAGQDAAALAVFQEALARAPGSTRVKVHLASTHQALGQWLEAERYLSDVLSEPEGAYIRRHRATLERAYEFVDRRIGSLDVVGSPEGAELSLSGRRIGTLPLEAPVRVPIGSYTLEVRKDGYHTLSRPVAISGRSLLRESVELGQREAEPPAWRMSAGGAGGTAIEDRSGSPRWLSWTLVGASAGAAAVSGVAFAVRERHADRWNSEECLAPGSTRGQTCPEELDAGRNAEQLAIGAAILSGVLLGGAVVSFVLQKPDEPDQAALTLEGCGLAAAGARCFGSF